MSKKSQAKKFLSVVLAVLMTVSIFVPSISAIDVTVKSEVFSLDDADDSKSYDKDIKPLEDLVDIDELRQYLFNGFYNCPVSLDISKFNIPVDKIDAVYGLIQREMPELFQVSYMGYRPSGGIVKRIYPDYHYTANEYHAMLAETRKAVDEMTADLVNSNLTDVEKALILHDRLIERCEYDYDALSANALPASSLNIYGAIVLGEAVCQGYTMAYEYLLDKVGILAHYSNSNALRHAWNIVCIDGDWYYVDTTWDDPLWDTNGKVLHNNFLVSYDVFKTGHKATDYEVPQPQSSKYDNLYWNNSKTGFQYLNGKFYYIDAVANEIKEITDITDVSTSKTIYKLGKWIVDKYYWNETFSKLSNDGEALLYTTPDSVCRLDVNTGASTVIWRPVKPTDLTRPFIMGFDYDGEYFTVVFDDDGNFNSNNKKLYTQKRPYDTKPHDYTSVVTTEPTCSAEGVRTYSCKDCNASYTEAIEKLAHTDGDNDGFCNVCGAEVEKCNHICHKGGFVGFIYKIVRLFWKLFKMNKTCACGIDHY